MSNVPSPMPASMYPNRPAVSLQVVVIGAGIAGISTAYALGKAGHHVTVVDKNDGNSKTARAIRCGPNMTKILLQWGLESTLKSISQRCSRIDWYSGTTPDSLGSMILAEDFLQDLGAEFYCMEQAQLMSALRELAQEERVTFHLNSQVLNADSITGSVLLHTGEKLYGDIIIGADGYDSILRSIVTDEVQEQEAKEGHVILSFTISTNILEADEELRGLMDPSAWSIWIGESHIIHANVLNQGRDYAVTILWGCGSLHRAIPEGDWSTIKAAVNGIGADLDKVEPRVKKLLGHATTISSRVVFSRSSVDNLICENSRIVLVGEAAHPVLPGVHHSQALSIEDAETLGSLFSRIGRKDQVSQLLTAYNEIRQPWDKFAVEHSYRNQANLEAKQGPIQEARDAKIRAMLVQMVGDHMDEELFKEVWGNELSLFSNDAGEKVEDWWCQYGSLIMRSPHRDSILSSVAVSVSQDTE
ncbi:hypothetical protein CPB84DRAFT_1729902 [Gymnopilus junonius]|uniref:FAD-binding domain-containing protein n=1 Tax=Gymnopilus junonius TaxID=109634 RepID=A0A9P5NR42_GYMJU|nr:hypothetical protein CPB84DRAFT_1729902 [Gymnopilus junonius]